ncbi:hypothetical protein PLESTB_001494800 [Pleodorina starrii]|uniref:Kinesin-like protein n=1 Tax=Pleodorina starrii TaxID=330485 RepID=A0A9W6BWG5_9CHLO|nr:hypothetical protein PLESTB_001494800 [Pleodorina starrii]
MAGYNGTIFAYGQTGSGKTFTITGGPERFVDRGIIPRAISAIFTEISNRPDSQYTVHISYLEIYNNEGYDLLDAEREIKALEDLQQVHLGEAEDGTVSYRNLSMYRANNEEEALNLLFLGDTNRTISETPMNLASSRSHCIFTIHIEGRKVGEDVVRRSKLNLVDLAGSERVSKTGVDGTTLREAKYINLSLHYLEQVIIALQEKATGMNRPHIPYRNSMMTMALKDSLGGNCRTTMVATVNSAQDQLDESISTCRFAQRVAMVRNTVLLNEELDPSLMIRRLKQEVRELKEEIRLLKGEEEERGPLTPDEIMRLQGTMEAWVADDSPEAALNLGGSMMMIRAAFDIFKRLMRNGGFKPGAAGAGGGAAGAGGAKGGGPRDSMSSSGMPETPGGAGRGGGGAEMSDHLEQIRKLKLQVAQRDNEIGILVSMLKRREAAGAKAPILGSPAASMTGPLAAAAGGAGGAKGAAGPGPGSMAAAAAAAAAGGGGGGAAGSAVGGPSSSASASSAATSVADEMAVLMNTNLLADRNKAFELFRKSYRQNEVIEENKALLKTKYDSAKALGAAVNDSKNRINELRAGIERHRMKRAAACVAAGKPVEGLEEDEEERGCKDAMDQEKTRYKDAFGQLRELKREIEHLHMLLEQSRTRLQRDFEQWMGLMVRQQQQQQQQQQHQQQQQQGGGGGGGLEGGVAGMPIPSASPHGRLSPVGPPAVPRQAWGDPSASTSSSPGPAAARAPGPLPLPGPGPAMPPQAAWAAASPSTSQSFQYATNGAAAAAYGYGPGPGPGPGGGGAAAGAASVRSSGVGPLGGGGGGGGGSAAALQGVDPAVLEAARPFLTGNPDADADIIKFYEAKAKLMQKLGTGGGG